MGRTGKKKKWLAIARDEQLKGSHILIVEAESIKSAYDQCTHQCIINKLKVPEQRAVYELKEDSSAHICTVLDKQLKEGLFNGQSPISIGPRAVSARPGASNVRSSNA